MEDLQNKIIELMDLFDGEVTTADKIPQPTPRQEVVEIDAVNEFIKRNPRADGGMLVQPSADGSRPGYAKSKKEKTTVVEGNKLAKQYNKIITTAFDKGDMSKIPSWKSFLESKTLKHAGTAYYRTNAANFGVINATAKKFELADRLIDEASKTLKYTEWMDIQKKLSPFKDIDTRTWREYIDKNTRINGQAAKVSQAFDYLLDKDIKLKIPKNLSKTMAVEGSLLRKVIADLTGAGKARIIDGLNMNDSYNKYIDQIKFANQGNLWTQGEGRTLSEILENADYRMKGNISWTSDIKLSNRANKNVFDYALRNFNYHQLNKTGEGTIQFYDKKTNKPIDWDTLPKNKNGFRVLKPNSVYFIDANDPNRTKWNMTSIDADNLKWSKGKGSSGLFDEVFQAKDKYDKLLATKVDDPRNPKKQISFGKLMSEVYQTGFDNFGNPYAIEHADGVANNPFKNLKIASQRVNSALSSLNRDTKLAKSQKNKIFKELQKNVFNPADQNMIDNLIKSTQPLQSDVLVKGRTIDGSELSNLLKVMQKADAQTAKDVGMVLNSGFPINRMAEEIAKIPGAKKFARGFMKVGGPFEVAFVGLDIANEVSKGAPLDTAVQTALSNITFGSVGDPEKYQMRDLTNAGNELGVNTQGFQELKDVLDLEKKIVSEKQLLKDMQTYNEQTGESALRKDFDLIKDGQTIDQETRLFDVNNQTLKIQELENSLTDKAKYLSQLDNIDTLYDDYVNSVQYLGRKEYNKVVDVKKNQVYPNMGTMGSDFMATIMSPIQSLLPQNLMETTNITRPIIGGLRNIPFIGGVFDPTSDAAKLSAMSEEEKNKRALDMNIVKQNVHPVMGQTMTGEQLAPYYEKFFAGGGRAGFKGGSKKSNYYSQIKEMLEHYNRYKYMPRSEGQKKPKKIIPLNIFAREFYKENLASGGLAGIKSGPPPESGPNPQGLSGLLKRGKNI